MDAIFSKYQAILDKVEPIKYSGTITRVQGLLIESEGPHAVVGELCQIHIPQGDRIVWAEVVGLHDRIVQLMPYDEMGGIEVGCKVTAMGESLTVPVSDDLLGRVLGPMGKPMDDGKPIRPVAFYPAVASPPDALTRKRITSQMITGIRAIDGLLATGSGQRMGIFSGSGVGKSTLLGMIARNTKADINVIGLIGERGREVREFIEHDLGEEGLARSVIVVSTSDTTPLSRLRGAYVATAVAEYFRDQGKDVMLLFDSVTRFARAQRELGLAIGEPPATRGYPPSVFELMPKLLERSGTSSRGSITAFYTILVDGDDMDEPVSDTARGILDGHIVLSRKLAEKYHFPAIDVLRSVSRLAPKITPAGFQKAGGKMRRLMATYAEAEDLINVGAYVKGSNPLIDEAISKMPDIQNFLTQGVGEKEAMSETIEAMSSISGIPVSEFGQGNE